MALRCPSSANAIHAWIGYARVFSPLFLILECSARKARSLLRCSKYIDKYLLMSWVLHPISHLDTRYANTVLIACLAHIIKEDRNDDFFLFWKFSSVRSFPSFIIFYKWVWAAGFSCRLFAGAKRSDVNNLFNYNLYMLPGRIEKVKERKNKHLKCMYVCVYFILVDSWL